MTDAVNHAFFGKREHELQPLYQKKIPNIFFWVASIHELKKKDLFPEPV